MTAFHATGWDGRDYLKAIRALREAAKALGVPDPRISWANDAMEFLMRDPATPVYLGELSPPDPKAGLDIRRSLIEAGFEVVLGELELPPPTAPAPAAEEPDPAKVTLTALMMLSQADGNPIVAAARCKALASVTGHPVFDAVTQLLIATFPWLTQHLEDA